MTPCPSPSKIPYHTEADARWQLKHFKANSRENKKTLNRMHAYLCPSGLHWHMGHNQPWKGRKARKAALSS